MKLIKPDTLVLEHHNIQYPEIPTQPPWDFRESLGRHKKLWRRVTKILWLVSSGFSLGKEIQYLIAESDNVSHRSGAIYRLFPRLIDYDILRADTIRLHRQVMLRLVSLGPNSEKLINRLKWQPVENEWGRMLRLHEKGKEGEERHTLSVIAFAYQARLRGYPAGVMPAVEGDSPFAPDVVVMQDSEPVMVEVERSYKRNHDKWEQMVDYQNFVAFCGRTEKHRNRLIQETDWNLGVPGQATDLNTLFNESWEKPYGPLWAETW